MSSISNHSSCLNFEWYKYCNRYSPCEDRSSSLYQNEGRVFKCPPVINQYWDEMKHDPPPAPSFDLNKKTPWNGKQQSLGFENKCALFLFCGLVVNKNAADLVTTGCSYPSILYSPISFAEKLFKTSIPRPVLPFIQKPSTTCFLRDMHLLSPTFFSILV